jgi:rSAM/selenodomain-associated transferase 2
MISVVIPVYKEGKGVVACLRALSELGAMDQCVVVDASRPDVFKMCRSDTLKALPDMNLTYLKAVSKGRAAQMNQGALNSRGDVLVFLHADTCLPDQALTLIRSKLGSGWHWGRFDVRFDNPRWWYRLISAMMNWRSRLSGIATGDQAMFMTRAAYDLVSGFDEIQLMEDIAMSKKLKTIGKPLCLKESVVTAARRWEQKGVFRTIITMWCLRLAYYLGVSPNRLAAWYYR